MDCNDHSKGGSPLPFLDYIIRSPYDHDGRRPISPNICEPDLPIRQFRIGDSLRSAAESPHFSTNRSGI